MRALVSCLVLLGATLAAQAGLPKPAGRVTDLANVIDAATEAEITSRLQRLEDQTSHEVAVATVTSLDGLTMDDYKVRLFKEWGVGQEKADNGVLIVVAPNEREIGIEVGYGLEGVLPDGLAGQIIRESFIPRFRDNDYNGGIRDGAARVADVVEKQQVLSAEDIARLNGGGSGGGSDVVLQWILIPFLGLFVAVGAGVFGGGVKAKENFLRLFGALFGGIPLLIALVVFPRLTAMTLVPLAFFMFMVGHWLGGRDWSSRNSSNTDQPGDKTRRTTSSSRSSSSSSSSSSSFGSSNSGGSSSSFGGGRSGGGGASGKW